MKKNNPNEKKYSLTIEFTDKPSKNSRPLNKKDLQYMKTRAIEALKFSDDEIKVKKSKIVELTQPKGMETGLKEG